VFAVHRACAISVVTFPLLLERDVGAIRGNADIGQRPSSPIPYRSSFGDLIVAVLLVLGSIAIFAGTCAGPPVLGHSWIISIAQNDRHPT